MVDAGGGNGILTQLERAGIRKEEIQDLFVTHTHTDHLLGCVWMMRMALQFHYPLRIWSHRKVLDTLTYICHQTLPPKEAENIGSLVTMNCLGDEPYSPLCREYVEGADWLLSEAFCLYEDRERFQPYEKNHSTVLDAARLAEELKVKNLILYHTEDKTLESRRERYTAEAESVFHGRVFVPDDLEWIEL